MRLLRYGFAVALFAGGAAAARPAEPSAAATITIENFRFAPAELKVSSGAVVRWVNKDDVPHTATAKGHEPAFDSKTLDTDEGFSFEFKKPGTYTYFCKVHPHMTGKVIVK